MNFVPVVLVLAAIGNSSEPTDYKTAFHRSMQGNKPLVVLVTAEWCPPCQMMKQTTIPKMVDGNHFRNFNFATVDVDKDRKNARNLIGGGQVPQLIVYENKGGKWQTRRLLGFHSVSSVQSFLGEPEHVRTANATNLLVDQ